MRRLLPFFALLALAGCGSASQAEEGGIVVVATTTQARDLAQRVLCRDAEATCAEAVRGLLGAEADPHDYELRPDDVDALAGAQLIVRSGGDFDAWLDEAIESSGSDAPVVDLLKAAGGEDPHWWTDPRLALRALAAIRDAAAAADPGNAEMYSHNARAYAAELRALDAAIAGCVAKVPAARRKVVTTHDALGPFASRYGIEIVGTVIPSRSTQAQASSGEVARLVRDIRRARATAIFSEATVSQDVERAIAEQAGARLGRPLRIDSLGDDTYLSVTAGNAQALVDGMSGGSVECSLPS